MSALTLSCRVCATEHPAEAIGTWTAWSGIAFVVLGIVVLAQRRVSARRA